MVHRTWETGDKEEVGGGGCSPGEVSLLCTSHTHISLTASTAAAPPSRHFCFYSHLQGPEGGLEPINLNPNPTDRQTDRQTFILLNVSVLERPQTLTMLVFLCSLRNMTAAEHLLYLSSSPPAAFLLFHFH